MTYNKKIKIKLNISFSLFLFCTLECFFYSFWSCDCVTAMSKGEHEQVSIIYILYNILYIITYSKIFRE